MKLKIRSTKGTAVLEISEDVSVKEMTDTLLKDHFPGSSVFSYKYGYPPKTVEALSEVTLKDAGIQTNDQIVAIDQDGASGYTVSAKILKVESPKAPLPDIPHVYIPELSTNLILRNVPDDNSCLFSSISLALTGTIDWKLLDLRRVVAETIQQSPNFYTKEILERPMDQYCAWIQKPESWGGAIELGILAKHLNVRIITYDIDLGQPITFQDETNPPERFILLIYSGVHYDALVTNKVLTSDKRGDVGVWDIGSDLSAASETLVKLLQTKNYATNTTKFRVRCLDCYEVLVGEVGASRHANSTGHSRFGEVS